MKIINASGKKQIWRTSSKKPLRICVKTLDNIHLRESDVRCALVGNLMKQDDLGRLQHTRDGSKSIPVHTEVRWYGRSGNLRWRSDIVIFEVFTLRVKNHLFQLPSKGYYFNKSKAIIEIKLRRTSGESGNQFISKIQQDIKKLRNIREEIGESCLCCVIILDRRRSITDKVPRDSLVKLYYATPSEKQLWIFDF